MKRKLFLSIISLSSLFVMPAFASTDSADSSSQDGTLVSQVPMIEATSVPVYEDKIDVSYLAKLVIHPKDDWIGRKVFKHDGVCVEVTKELKFKTIQKPFKNLYRSANLPKKVEIGQMNIGAKIVDCSNYQSSITTLE
ncbi:hypothetical protein [Photobacterium kishitanii]|uniref:DUF2541 domain-containing protein n=1 Tax=Photobacterium kishitanii TaxID=318456 RepID=A0A2T3KMV5_9GAMM|nr:hypothetical protein [Photobacterium kishitanii]PSV01129.1 hypothetical protein C9J27_03660 [Photobacterium kishitanii]